MSPRPRGPGRLLFGRLRRLWPRHAQLTTWSNSAIAPSRKNRFCVRQAAGREAGCAFVREKTIMKLVKTLLAASALVALMAGGAAAKQLVYCSEGSPEGF